VFTPSSVNPYCVIVRCALRLHVCKALLPAPQAACTALAQMVAASSDAKQQVMSMADHDLPPWPEVALFVRQVNLVCCGSAVLNFRTVRLLFVCWFARQHDALHGNIAFVSTKMQKLRGQTKRGRMMGEKALQQVDQALQGGQHPQQGDSASSAKGAPPTPQRSQADADLAMQMLLVTRCSQLCSWTPCS
jgi:hypothetical protein